MSKLEYSHLHMENAAEIGLIVGAQGQDFNPNEHEYDGINDWIIKAAVEFEKEHPAGTFSIVGDYYERIEEWTLARMVTERIES